MTSPYSSSLLQQPVDARQHDVPRPHPHPHRQPHAHPHTRAVTHFVPQPQAMHYPVAPQPQVVPQHAGSGGGAVSAVALALVVVLLGAVALVGAYVATSRSAASPEELALVREAATRDAFRAGRLRGLASGRELALEGSSTTIAMRASLARQRAWDAAYRRGERAGRRSYRPPTYFGGYGGGGYRAPRFGGFGSVEVASALGQAQQLANVTGAPVDVEIY